MKILVVEDEYDLRTAVVKGLSKRGYAVDAAANGQEALDFLDVYEYDLMVLDLNLPQLDGMEVLARIRPQKQNLKVLILSARSEVEDRILGLDSGANDYLVKPFHFSELEARIRALLRVSGVQQPTVYQCGEVSLDPAARQVTDGGELVDLTKLEFSILEYLLRNQDKPVSFETLIEHVWNSEAELYSNAIKVHIHSLRKKLHSDIIKNVRGVGYMARKGTVE